MSFRARAFLFCVAPFAALLTGGFWVMQGLVRAAVGNGLRSALKDNQTAIGRARAKSEAQTARFVRMAGENASLKAGAQLLLDAPDDPEARRTVSELLMELGEAAGLDFLALRGPGGNAMAAAMRGEGARLEAVDGTFEEAAARGIVVIGGRTFDVSTVAIDQGNNNLGSLSIGERFDLALFATPAVLLRAGHTLAANVPGLSPGHIENALSGCRGECEVAVDGTRYLSLPIADASLGPDYSLRTFIDVDRAAGPVDDVLKGMFAVALAGAVSTALLFGMVSSRAIVSPISAIVVKLKEAAASGEIPEFVDDAPSAPELRELTLSFNKAAASTREARHNLQAAYIEFVGSLANALDARDPYTAGHSQRVSDLAAATAAAIGLPSAEVERVRTGALLHDIGKIGVSDAILTKPGKLTPDEYSKVKEHPTIGRKILEGVNGFAPYLTAVEMHHENWDGTGYPLGRKGDETPIDARIIHVVDAYDAMTSDRPYRKGMSHARAIAIVREYAGTQFDPIVAEAFTGMPPEVWSLPTSAPEFAQC